MRENHAASDKTDQRQKLLKRLIRKNQKRELAYAYRVYVFDNMFFTA